MGRPPCCDHKSSGVKKGPWTPEEDIILVSYIQQHGPGNWRLVPNITGLLRCSKSCRLRWTNYLRPGIKRGDFTHDEENIIIHLQALLGNRWAAIASYLPERTDNDIKNYWNTHLKKKLLQSSHNVGQQYSKSSSVSKGQWERRLQTDIHTAKKALCDALSLDKSPCSSPKLFPNIPQQTSVLAQTSAYASSTENIARLLANWMTKSPNSSTSVSSETTSFNNNNSSSSVGLISSPIEMDDHDESKHEDQLGMTEEIMPLSLLEKWLLDDDDGVQGQEGYFMDMDLDDYFLGTTDHHLAVDLTN